MLNNYFDPPGLGKALMDAGLPVSVTYYDHLGTCILETPNDAAAQAIVDAWTLEDSVRYVKAEVSAHAKELRDKVISGVSPGEMASWPIKLAEARTFAATGNADLCPMLSAEAAARGVSVNALVARVNGNAAMFAGLEAAISGVDGKHRDALDACTSFEEVKGYNWRTGWPEV